MEILRSESLQQIELRFVYSKAVAILGPRQSGKTTLAKQFVGSHDKEPIHYFDCEDFRDLERLKDPFTALFGLKGYVVIDEVQKRPDLFPTLRVLIDRQPETKFLILGSASRDLLKQSSETLAGRIAYVELRGLPLSLVGREEWRTLWLRGGFPSSFLASNEDASFGWREDFVKTFLERDVPSLGFRVSSVAMQRAWTMLAHLHGQIFNASSLGKSLDVKDVTARHYLDILTEALVVRQLHPWHTNTKKRIIKRPKAYVRDSGLLHALLSIRNFTDLHRHPVVGFSFEGFILEQVMQQLDLRSEEMFFFGLHAGGEIDCVWQDHGRMWGMEVKFGDAPRMTPAIHSAIKELDLAHVWIVYPGDKKYSVHERVTCLPLQNIGEIQTS